MPLLLLLAAVPMMIALGLAARPPTAARVAAFARRHHLDPTMPVVAYLAHTRRWRVAGALAGLLTGVVITLPEQRVALQLIPLLAGWFAGAVIAELRFRPAGLFPPAPGSLPRVPPVLAGSALAGTALALVLAGDFSGTILAWGAAALAVALLNRQVVTSPAAGAITAAAAVLTIACLVRQLGEVQDRFFDTAATAAGAVALLWTLGSLAVAFTLWRGPSVRPALLIAAALVVVSVAGVGFAWWKDRPPFAATAVRATATLRFTDYSHFDRDARTVGVTGLTGLVDIPDHRQFVGRVDYTAPPCAGCTYQLLVIDEQQNRLSAQLFDTDGGGWSSQLSTLAARYPWLSATAAQSGGMAVSQAADEPGPMVFNGSFATGTPAPRPLVVLVLTGPESQIYWARHVTA